jgi:hypothetical protein
MEQKGLTVKDLEPMIGKSNRVYEVLNHKRSLTLKMIWRLHEQLGIPAESLIKQPPRHPCGSATMVNRGKSLERVAQRAIVCPAPNGRALAATTIPGLLAAAQRLESYRPTPDISGVAGTDRSDVDGEMVEPVLEEPFNRCYSCYPGGPQP